MEDKLTSSKSSYYDIDNIIALRNHLKYNEIWDQISFVADIKRYRYDASSFGNFKEYDVDINDSIYHSSNGYDYILLFNDNGCKLYKIDMIIASLFMPKPYCVEDCNAIKHIDGNTRNNMAYNLEWYHEDEVLKPIEYKDVRKGKYKISNFGRVWNNETDSEQKTHANTNGYLQVGLSVENGYTQRSCRVHRLVANEFLPWHDETSDIVNHIDGNILNNHYMNLEWTTLSGNTQHAYYTGLASGKFGEENPASILTNDLVKHICELLIRYDGSQSKVLNQLAIEGHVNIQKNIIDSIKLKECWSNISDNYFKYEDFNHKTALDENDIHKICMSLIKHNGSSKAVLNELSSSIPILTYKRIIDIKMKVSWRSISDKYFKDNDFNHDKTTDMVSFTPRHLFTDDEVHEICKVLVDNNGSNVRTVEQLKNKYPTLSINYLQKLKVKECKAYISDQYFDRDTFKMKFALNEELVHKICKLLVKYHGSYPNTLNDLQDEYPSLTKKQIESVKLKAAWKRISDQYFTDPKEL